MDKLSIECFTVSKVEGPALRARGLCPDLTGRAGAKTWGGPYLWAPGEISTGAVKKTVTMKSPLRNDQILNRSMIVAPAVTAGMAVLAGEVSFDYVVVTVLAL